MDLAEEEPKLNFDAIFHACLLDPDEIVRVRAIEGLWEYENNSIIDRFITMLKEDCQESVRAAAAQALGRFALLAELGFDEATAEAVYQMTSLAKFDDRFVIPAAHREQAIEMLESTADVKGNTGFGWTAKPARGI